MTGNRPPIPMALVLLGRVALDLERIQLVLVLARLPLALALLGRVALDLERLQLVLVLLGLVVPRMLQPRAARTKRKDRCCPRGT